LHESRQKTRVKESERKVNQHIAALKKELEGAFHQLEQTVYDETVQLQQKLLTPIELQLSSIESLRGSLQDLKKKMKTVEDFGQEIHTVLMERKLCEEINNLQAKFRRLYESANCSEISSAALDGLMKKVMEGLSAENIIKKIKSPKPQMPYVLGKSLGEITKANISKSRIEVQEAVSSTDTIEESFADEQLEGLEDDMDQWISWRQKKNQKKSKRV
jgi:hypothetical protein